MCGKCCGAAGSQHETRVWRVRRDVEKRFDGGLFDTSLCTERNIEREDQIMKIIAPIFIMIV